MNTNNNSVNNNTMNEDVKVFVVSRTAHYNGTPMVAVVTTNDLNSLAEYGWKVGKTYRRARFHNHSCEWRALEDMGIGMVLKGERGEYIHRVA